MCIRQAFGVLALTIVVVIVPVDLHAQDKNVKLDIDTLLPSRVKTPGQETSPTQYIDSLKQNLKSKVISKRDSAKQASPFDTLSVEKLTTYQLPQDSLALPTGAVDSLGITQKLHALQDKSNALLSQQGVDTTRLPTIALPSGDGHGLTEMVDKAGNLNLPDIGNTVGELPLNDLDNNINIPDAQASIPSDLQLPEVPAIGNPGEAIEGIGNVDVSKLGENVKPVEEALQNVEGLKDRAKDLQKPDLEKIGELSGEVESKLEEMAPVDELEKQTEALEKMKAIRAKWTDPAVAKEEALNKAKQSAVNHFAGHTEQLQATMQKLSELKAKHPHAEGVLDLFAKRQRPLKGIPFVERLIPGFTFQFQKSTAVMLDLNPQVGLKITGRFIAGLGWNDRLAYDFDAADWDKEWRMYGARSFVHFKLLQNFYLKADAEYMKAKRRTMSINTVETIPHYGWGWNYLVGIKKDFQLSRRTKWNTQFLYNLYSAADLNPYTNKFNLRLGFEVPLVKRSREERKRDREQMREDE